MNNTTIHISLPEPLVESAKARAEDEKFGNMSDYVRSLIREDLRRMEEQKLEQMLLEGVRSGRGMEVGSDEWRKFWEEIDRRIQEKSKSQA
jgi:antitoxin ParD1/3/4